MSKWRYLAYRATTGERLHTELPITPTTRGWELSAPGVFSGFMPAGVAAPEAMIAPDGRPVLEEWGTRIYVEADGIIRWGGIVISSRFVGARWEIECAGMSTYLHGIPWTAAEYMGVQVDPAQILRDIWAHVQSHPDGDLGVQVVGSTKVRLGSASTLRAREAAAAEKLAKAAYDAANKELKIRRDARTVRVAAQEAQIKPLKDTRDTMKGPYEAARDAYDAAQEVYLADPKNAAKKAARDAAKALKDVRYAPYKTASEAVTAMSETHKAALVPYTKAIEDQQKIVEPLKATYDARKEARADADEAERADGGAYLLQWWETPDLGEEVDALARQVPFDWVEEHAWDGDDIVSRIRIGHPRLGRRRNDLAFELGVNILAFEDPTRDGDSFANEVIGLGAGEGQGSLRRSTAVRDGRLRRPVVITAKDVTKKDRLDAIIRDERIRRQQLTTISSITVRDHPHARIGSWALGDDILVQATVPWLGDVAIWHRIVAWELLTDTTARLELQRSDTFTYGG